MPTMQASKKGVVKYVDLGCEICENYVKSLSGYGSVVQFWSLIITDQKRIIFRIMEFQVFFFQCQILPRHQILKLLFYVKPAIQAHQQRR